MFKRQLKIFPIDFLIELQQLDSRMVGKLTSKLRTGKIDDWQSKKSVKCECYKIVDQKMETKKE